MKRFRREVVRRDVLLSFGFWPPGSRLPSFLEGLSPFVVLSVVSGVWLLTEANPDILNSSNSIEPVNRTTNYYNCRQSEEIDSNLTLKSEFPMLVGVNTVHNQMSTNLRFKSSGMGYHTQVPS